MKKKGKRKKMECNVDGRLKGAKRRKKKGGLKGGVCLEKKKGKKEKRGFKYVT